MTPEQATAKLAALGPAFRIGGWAVAHDGRCVLGLFRDDLTTGEPPSEKVATQIGDWFALPDGVTVNLAALREWCGPICRRCAGRNTAPCATCGGRGRWQHECPTCEEDHEGPCLECTDGMAECPSCDYPDKSAGHVFRDDEPVSRRLLGAVLAGLPGEVAVAQMVPQNMGSLLLLSGGGWRVGLMSMRGNPTVDPFLAAGA